MIDASHLSVQIGGKALLNDVSLRVAPGEVIALLGPNGAGKSTLLRAISDASGLVSGQVCMEGRKLSAWGTEERARARAILLQESTLSFPFSVLEVVLMGRTPHSKGYERPYDYVIARAALEIAEVAHLEERRYPTLSGGERQRVQFARVLAQIWEAPGQGSRYLFLDEPTSSLDLSHQHAILKTARAFAQQNVGVLVVLHDLNLAAQYADRVIILKQGHICFEGTPHEVFTSPNILDAFGMPVVIIPHPCLSCPLVVPALAEAMAV